MKFNIPNCVVLNCKGFCCEVLPIERSIYLKYKSLITKKYQIKDFCKYEGNRYLLPITEDNRCIFVDDNTGLCKIYHQRPIFCQVYGMVPELPCHKVNPEYIYESNPFKFNQENKVRFMQGMAKFKRLYKQINV